MVAESEWICWSPGQWVYCDSASCDAREQEILIFCLQAATPAQVVFQGPWIRRDSKLEERCLGGYSGGRGRGKQRVRCFGR
ncbi:hypothetical protein B0H12DRAFT_1111122 [Mycena haematopus]|nr:hypothetical protein B0H12DRAFT_1111122 [Mycena haematopus]